MHRSVRATSRAAEPSTSLCRHRGCRGGSTVSNTTAAVAVCVIGEPRSLLSRAVSSSFRHRLVDPLLRSSFKVDVFFVLSILTSHNLERARLRDAVNALYQARSVALWNDSASTMLIRHLSSKEDGCRIHPLWAALGSFRQWISIRACYDDVEAAERQDGRPYKWLVRTRTDLAYLSDLDLSSLSEQHVHIPAAGMHDESRCINDHIFVCPRLLCRPYFRLVDLWERSACMANGLAEPIFARNVSGRWETAPLAGPYSMPAVPAWASGEFPKKLGYGPGLQYIFFARYTDGRQPRMLSKDCGGGGLLREFAWAYALVRGNASRGFVWCESRWNLWLGRSTAEQEAQMRAVVNSSAAQAERYRAICWKLDRTFPFRQPQSRDGAPRPVG